MNKKKRGILVCVALTLVSALVLVSCSETVTFKNDDVTQNPTKVSVSSEKVGKEVFGLKKLSDGEIKNVSVALTPENISKDGIWKEHAFAVVESETDATVLTFSLPFRREDDVDFFETFRESDSVQYASDKRTIFSVALGTGSENYVSVLYVADKNEVRLLPWGQYMVAGERFVYLENDASSGKNRKICLYSLDGDFEKTVAGETSVDTVCYVSDSKLFYACAEKGESEDEKELNYRVYRYDLETEEQTQLTEFTAYYITGMDDSRIICYGADGEKIVNY